MKYQMRVDRIMRDLKTGVSPEECLKYFEGLLCDLARETRREDFDNFLSDIAEANGEYHLYAAFDTVRSAYKSK